MTPPQHAARLEEQASRLYELYERKAGRFHTSLIAVSTLVTVVFVLILYPYATFRGSRYALEASLQDLRVNLDNARRDAEASAALLDEYRPIEPWAIQLIRDVRVEALAEARAQHEQELAAIKASLKDDPRLDPWLSGTDPDRELPWELRREHDALLDLPDRPCLWRIGEAWLRCAVKEAVDRAHGEASRPFAYQRISHLRNDLFGPLRTALEKLNRSFGEYLLGRDTVWRIETADLTSDLLEPSRRYLASGGRDLAQPALQVPGELTRQLDRFGALYEDLLIAHHAGLNVTAGDMAEAVRQLERREQDLIGELATIDARLDEMKGLQDIETPFGTLPVGLNELTLLFPVLLAAGFLLCASLFVESLMLRWEFHKLTRTTDPDGALMPDDRILLIAPLWIDPLQPPGHRIYRAAILGLPVLVAAAAVAVLVRNQLLSEVFLREARLNGLVYTMLYGASAVAMMEGIRRISISLWRYPARIAAASAMEGKQQGSGEGPILASEGPSADTAPTRRILDAENRERDG